MTNGNVAFNCHKDYQVNAASVGKGWKEIQSRNTFTYEPLEIFFSFAFRIWLESYITLHISQAHLDELGCQKQRVKYSKH